MTDFPDYGEKEFDGVGYPTPSSIPEETTCRRIQVPADGAWQAVLMGMLYTGCDAANWQQFEGGITPDEAAERWQLMFEDIYANLGCPDSVPTPYWDDQSDLDDQLPADSQIWYGIFDGEFHETVENFAIAGFLAFAGEIGAAIYFLTIAPKFRLAWKTGNLGGIIRVIVDGADAGSVDTFSDTDGVLERDFAGDPEEESHSILMYLESVP